MLDATGGVAARPLSAAPQRPRTCPQDLCGRVSAPSPGSPSGNQDLCRRIVGKQTDRPTADSHSTNQMACTFGIKWHALSGPEARPAQVRTLTAGTAPHCSTDHEALIRPRGTQVTTITALKKSVVMVAARSANAAKPAFIQHSLASLHVTHTYPSALVLSSACSA